MLDTHRSSTAARAVRVDKRTKDAQARLAQKSFTDFMREHNAKRARLDRKGE